MVCEVCGVDRSDESGELVILDYPRFMAADCPCLNCGGLLVGDVGQEVEPLPATLHLGVP